MEIIWGRIALAALVCHAVYSVYLLRILRAPERALTLQGILVAASLVFVGGIWLGSQVETYGALQGALLGLVIAVVFTLVSTFAGRVGPQRVRERVRSADPLPINLILLHHACKIVSGAIGGYLGSALSS